MSIRSRIRAKKSGGSSTGTLACASLSSAYTSCPTRRLQKPHSQEWLCYQSRPHSFILYSSSCHQTFKLCAYNGSRGKNLLTSPPLTAWEQSPANPVEIAEGPSFQLEPSRKYPGALIV